MEFCSTKKVENYWCREISVKYQMTMRKKILTIYLYIIVHEKIFGNAYMVVSMLVDLVEGGRGPWLPLMAAFPNNCV